MSRRLNATVTLILLMFSLGCSGGDGPVEPPPVDDGVQIGASGGTATFLNGAVVLEVPAGAVSNNVSITVDPISNPLDDDHLLAGTAYEFGPNGTVFAVPVRLTLAFDPGTLPEDATVENVAIGRFSGSEWQPLATDLEVDLEAGSISGNIDQFSSWSVMHEPCEPVQLSETQRGGSLSNEDCIGFDTGPARWVDYWTPLATSTGLVRFTVRSSLFSPHIGLDVNGVTYGQQSGSETATVAIAIPFDVVPKFWISSVESLGEGPFAYTVEREAISSSHDLGCNEALKVVPGFVGNASLSTTDCLITIEVSPVPFAIGKQVYEEYYRVVLLQGQTITITVTRTGGEAEFRPFPTLWLGGLNVIQGDPSKAENTITFTAPSTDSYLFSVSGVLRWDEGLQDFVPTTGTYRYDFR